MASSRNDDNGGGSRLERLKNEIDALRSKISTIPPAETPTDLLGKAKQQKLLATKVGVYEMLKETERVSAVVRKHDEMHPPRTEDCPICLEPINIIDDTVQNFACCGNFICSTCGNENWKNGHFELCPLCRGPPAKGEDLQNKLMKERAQDGRAWAQYNLGRWYMSGDRRGFPWKPKKALRWLEASAEQHFPDALYELAQVYYTGYPCMVEQSHSKAFSLFKEAADIGCAVSQSNVGICYADGKGVEVNELMAVHYFTLAYNQNQCKTAGYYLGGFFFRGAGGLEKSLPRAKHYLEGAAKEGLASAYLALATVLMELSKEQYAGQDIPGHSCIPRVLYWTRKASKELTDPSAPIAARNLELIESYEDASCSSCFKTAQTHHPKKLTRCARCMAVWYCDKECQRKHWLAGHKVDCVKHND